jgi:hypothetical protein
MIHHQQKINRGYNMKIIFRGIILIAIISSCSCVNQYSGDGQLIDKGPFSATDRYILNLGEIELKNPSLKLYRLENLPAANFVVGMEIRVSPENRSVIENKSIKPLILIELLGPQKEIIFRDQSSLDTWVWSVRAVDNTVFIYKLNNSSTFFTAIAKEKYNLKVSIVQPDANKIDYTVRLLAKSGGWK